jgi:hypothetical protein
MRAIIYLYKLCKHGGTLLKLGAKVMFVIFHPSYVKSQTLFNKNGNSLVKLEDFVSIVQWFLLRSINTEQVRVLTTMRSKVA